MEEGCVILNSVKAVLPIELLYWEEDTILGLSSDEKLHGHVALLENVIDKLKKSGYSIIACICGGLNENSNMYLLLNGCIRFGVLPQGFNTYGLLNQDGKEFTLLHPTDYNHNITLLEMQDYLNKKALVLKEWAEGGTR